MEPLSQTEPALSAPKNAATPLRALSHKGGAAKARLKARFAVPRSFAPSALRARLFGQAVLPPILYLPELDRRDTCVTPRRRAGEGECA